MVFPIYVYAIGSFALSGWAAYTMGLSAGFYAMLSSTLFVMAGGGFKASLGWGDVIYRISGFVGAIVLVAIALWLSRGFVIMQLFDYPVGGAEWGGVGFVICFVFADRRLVGR